MKIFILIAILISSGLGGLLTYCAHIENPTSSFATYEEANASGLIEKGWIPNFIPHSSTDIRETHDIDTNNVNMSFKYTIGDTEEVSANCTTEKSSMKLTRYKCLYFDNKVIIELYADGRGEMKSSRY